MTSTNKSFAYVFNKPFEDHKATRDLSGRHPNTVVSLLSLEILGFDTKTTLAAVATELFNASHGLTTTQYKVNGWALETLITYC